MKKKVLLTGGTGFLGRHCIVPLLEAGYEVHALSSKIPGPFFHSISDQVFWHQCDLLDPLQIEQVVPLISADYLLHFAWYVEHGKFWRANENLLWVEATLRLLRYFINPELSPLEKPKERITRKRVLMAGTCAEYQWQGESIYLTEQSPTVPNSLYGTCKNATRMLAEAYCQENQCEFSWGRIFHIYGDGETETRLVPQLIKAFLRDQQQISVATENELDFIHVKDLGRAFVKVLDSNFCGPINMASGKSQKLGQIFDLIKSHLPNAKASIVDRPYGGVSQGPRVISADTSKLEALGFHAEINLKDGLKEIVASWIKN